MTTNNKYGLKVVVSFSIVLLSLIMGSFVVSLKYIDLAYFIVAIAFGIEFIRLG